jgi:hypothetical protein
MSFINYSNFAAYPQYQVIDIMRHPATGRSAPVSSSIPAFNMALLAPTQFDSLSQETQALASVQSTAHFAAQVAPRLQASSMKPVPSQTFQSMQDCCSGGSSQNQFFSGSFYSQLR